MSIGMLFLLTRNTYSATVKRWLIFLTLCVLPHELTLC